MSGHSDKAIGVVLAVVSGIVQGHFTAPMKYTSKQWQFEHSWVIFSITLSSLCCIAAFGTIRDVPELIDEFTLSKQLLIVVLGMAWGFGMVLFGFAATIVGHGLAFSMVLGLSASLGTLIPLLVFHLDTVGNKQGILTIIGVGIAMIGIGLTGMSGMRREKIESDVRSGNYTLPFLARESVSQKIAKEGETEHHPRATGKKFMAGVLMCVVAGVLSSFFNLALSYAKPMAALAGEKYGAPESQAGNIMWLMIITCGGGMVTLVYSLGLLVKNGTIRTFYAEGGKTFLKNLGLSLLQGFLFWGGNEIFGFSLAFLGHKMGNVVGFPISMAMNIVTSNVFGALTGEWKFSDKRAIAMGVGGNLIILLSVGLIGAGSFVAPAPTS